MSDVLIERVLLGHLVAKGMSRDQVALLTDAARKGSRTAHRLLGTTAGSAVTTTVPCPVDEDGKLVPSWTDEPVSVATVPLSSDYGWIAGELLDPKSTVPQTIAIAAIGRPIGKLLKHRDIDPEGEMRMPQRRHAVVAVPMETVRLTIPKWPRGRVWMAWTLLRRDADKDIGRSRPARGPMSLCMTLSGWQQSLGMANPSDRCRIECAGVDDETRLQ